MDRDLQMLRQIDNPLLPWPLAIEPADRQRLRRRGWLQRYDTFKDGYAWRLTEAGRALDGESNHGE